MCVGRRVEFLETQFYHQLPFQTGSHLSSVLSNDTTDFFLLSSPANKWVPILATQMWFKLTSIYLPCVDATHFNDV